MGKGQAHYSLVIEQIGHVKTLTNTCQETPNCGYTEHVVEEQSGTDDELGTQRLWDEMLTRQSRWGNRQW